MKRNENYPKYVQAMHLMDEGKTQTYICNNLKMGRHTLILVRQRYLKGGERALLYPPHQVHVEPHLKAMIVRSIQEKGLSLSEAAVKYDKPAETLKRWVNTYQAYGEAGFIRKKMAKKRQRTEEELDELEMLRKRNEYLEAENALLKKVKALVEEREARLRAIGRKPSKD